MRPGLGVSGPTALLRDIARRAKRGIGVGCDPGTFPVRHLPTLNALLAECGVPPLSPDPQQADTVAGAARYVLARAASSWGYPRAFTDGPTGAFVERICRGLNESGQKNVRETFESDPGRRVGRVFEFREDLRGIWPLALTPVQRGEFLRWLLTFGKSDFALPPEAALWFLLVLDEDPSQGLATTYRLQPRWQAAVPHGLTRFGWGELKRWVGAEYGVAGRWLRRATLPPQFRPWDELQILRNAKSALRATDPAALPGANRTWRKGLDADTRDGLPDRLGVNVVGLFRYTSGLQQAVRACVAGLESAGVRTALRDYPVLFSREPRDKNRYDDLERFDTTILSTGIDTPVDVAYRESGWHPRPGVYRVAMWWWEMETLPPKWLDRAAGVDEIWGPTRFIAGAMRAAFPGKPVRTMLPGLTPPEFDPLPKSYFGLAPDRTTFGFVFDMNSRMQRKNPLGLIRAFRKAFRPSDPVDLVLKVSPPERFYAREWDELRAAAADAGVRVLDRVLTRPELYAFINALDCYVSLHRSEGFGLTCAEAMLLGKPTVATGYSGNLDFMTEANSYLVGYERVTLEEDFDPYFRGGVWAEPDVTHAADLLRRVYDRPDEARAVGERGRAEAGRVLSVEASGQRLLDRLKEIEALRCGGR
jgi:glycosyltransferase involved in cell wall biosynthesis